MNGTTSKLSVIVYIVISTFYAFSLITSVNMVKHGTAKKRRRNQKVARKGPVHRAIKISCGVPQNIKEAYDKNKSPADK